MLVGAAVELIEIMTHAVNCKVCARVAAVLRIRQLDFLPTLRGVPV